MRKIISLGAVLLLIGLFALAVNTILHPLGSRAAILPVKEGEPVHISYGERIDLRAYLAPGKITIFDFFSPHCPPCRALAPRLEELRRSRSDLVVVVVEIDRPGAEEIDWNSPVSRQFHLQSIPYLQIFNPRGELEKEGEAAFRQVLIWIEHPGSSPASDSPESPRFSI